jgi:predicted DNA-binding antitoxin AbrB/MazE fold protein
MALAKHKQQTVDAIYEHGTLRLLHTDDLHLEEGQRVRVIVEPSDDAKAIDSLELLGSMYDGLSTEEINEIEGIILDRGNFFGDRPLP